MRALFVSLRLRGVERRGHKQPPTEPIHQTPVTSEPRRCSPSVDSAAVPVCCFSVCISLFLPLDAGSLFFPVVAAVGVVYSACPEIFTISKKSQTASQSKQEESVCVLTCPIFAQEMCNIHTSRKQITAGVLINARVEISLQLGILTTFPSFKSYCV